MTKNDDVFDFIKMQKMTKMAHHNDNRNRETQMTQDIDAINEKYDG